MRKFDGLIDNLLAATKAREKHMRTKETIILLLCLAFFAACGRQEPPTTDRASYSLAIRDVTVIDPAERAVLKERTVWIDGSEIAAITGPGEGASFDASRIVDGRNRYLVPGFLDMHVHLADKLNALGGSGPLFIANGVTGVRVMSGDCWAPLEKDAVCIDDLRRLDEQIEAGEAIGPHLLSLSSAIVDGPVKRDDLPEGASDFFYPANEAEGRKLARYLDRRGVDFIKTYKLMPRDAYFALIDEASELGLPVAGHVPRAINVTEAANAGHLSIEHARALPYDCSDYGPIYRAAMSRVADQEPGAEAPEDETRLRCTIGEFSPDRCAKVLAALVENDTYYVPTHETREMDARAGQATYRNDPRLEYMNATLVEESWIEDLDETAAASPEVRALFEAFYTHGLRITGLAHDAGVKIMVGTDANDTMVFPGFSLHDEFVHLSKAGLEPMEILRAATVVPAEFLDRADRIGAVDVGMNADLVLLESNPLETITNTRSIAAVIFNGMLLDRDALDRMLDAARVQSTAAR